MRVMTPVRVIVAMRPLKVRESAERQYEGADAERKRGSRAVEAVFDCSSVGCDILVQFAKVYSFVCVCVSECVRWDEP